MMNCFEIGSIPLIDVPSSRPNTQIKRGYFDVSFVFPISDFNDNSVRDSMASRNPFNRTDQIDKCDQRGASNGSLPENHLSRAIADVLTGVSV
jgi:hypothetical protein